eukprot:sb/3464518/
MRYPVPSGCSWVDVYHLVRLPETTENISVPIRQKAVLPTTTPPPFLSATKGNRVFRELPVVKNEHSKTSVGRSKVKVSEKINEDFQNMSLTENVTITYGKNLNKRSDKSTAVVGPVCQLRRVVGFGPCRNVLLSSTSEFLYYAAGSMLVEQRLDTSEQRIFAGHTDTVLAFTVNPTDEYLASSQRDSPLVRLWSLASGECIGLVKSSEDPCTILQFSTSDKCLLGVCAARPRSRFILWDTSLLKLKGDVSIVTEGSCSDTIITAQLSSTSSSRIASCSSRALQIWRIRAGKLKTCSISSFNGLEYVLRDVKWGTLASNTEEMIYVGTGSGIVVQVDSHRAVVVRCIDLTTVEGPGIKSLNGLAVHGAFSVTVGEDGMLRVWDPEWREVMLKVGHEAAVTGCGVSTDGLKLLAVTETDTVGVLDATTKSYTTVVRSHSKRYLCNSYTPILAFISLRILT